MSTIVDILCFCLHPNNKLKIKYAYNLEPLIYVGTSQITQIFSHLKLWIAVARHNFKWIQIKISKLSVLRFNMQKGHGATYNSMHLMMHARKCTEPRTTLSPQDALKHHFTSLKTYLIFL